MLAAKNVAGRAVAAALLLLPGLSLHGMPCPVGYGVLMMLQMMFQMCLTRDAVLPALQVMWLTQQQQ
jgi:hypothetical protein